ncbi:hypothetical protein QOZ80_6BG0491270 [Eleusine coracana subsp. coracana]|nr:hypothetical protein QOZ80_6BG0491270 [Eleusine coracana subsp. coracana]
MRSVRRRWRRERPTSRRRPHHVLWLRVAGEDGHRTAGLHRLRRRDRDGRGEVRRSLPSHDVAVVLPRRRLRVLLLLLMMMIRRLLVATAAGGERDGDGHRGLVVQCGGEAVEGWVRERGGHDDDVGGRVERAGHGAADDLAVRACERDGDARGGEHGLRRDGGDGGGQERGGDGEDLVLPAEHEPAAAQALVVLRGERVAERDVGDGAGAGEHADAEVAAGGEARERLRDVAAAGDLDDVGPHGRRGVGLPRDHDGRLGPVLGPRGPAPPLLGHLDAGPVAGDHHHGPRRPPRIRLLELLGAAAAVNLVGEALQLLLLLLAVAVVGWLALRLWGRHEVNGWRHVIAVLVQALLLAHALSLDQ